MMAAEGTNAMPAALAAIPSERVVSCDVREDLRNGREPFGRIMEAKDAIPQGGALELRAIFEPAPLYAVMARNGFTHWTEKLAADDWRIWFYRAEEEAAAPAPAPAAAEVTPDSSNLVVLDVRGLEPPEPLVRTLEALDALPEGAALLQVNVRVPQFLIPQLKSRGFVHKVLLERDDRVEILIRRATD